MFKLYNSFGELSTIFLLFWANLWLWLFYNTFTKFPIRIVFDQLTLYHRNQIAMIVVYYKAHRALAPCARSGKVMVVEPVILVVSVKHHIRTTE
jgi:hypothetical protein